ncbi:hypothetical protein C2S51_009278 [Perilla frutescens var. frutescens]|nr:hypothetical protein C2S51_009278 [Perilla frutescens var. frutescens]
MITAEEISKRSKSSSPNRLQLSTFFKTPARHSSEDAPSSEDVQKSSSSGHSSAGNEEEKHTHLRFLFSKDDFASLMGQGGSPIRLIQSESGAGIQWSHDYEYLPGTGTADRIIEVSGAVQNIKKTVHLILDKLVGLELAPLALLSPVYHPTGDYSKYLTEFEELECIGTGGFGVVASCVNKLDKKLYVVKKIPINYSQLSTQKLLSFDDIVNFDAALTLGENCLQTSNSFGTKMYKAPEHQVGAQLDQKIDVFSLGVILAELLHPFGTGAERIEVLTRLKKTGPPDDWLDHPYTPIIKRLLEAEPCNRPTVTEILHQIEDMLVGE